MLLYNEDDCTIQLLRKSVRDLSTYHYKDCTHGHLLALIQAEFKSYLEPFTKHHPDYNNFVFVREKGFLNSTTYILSKVNGVLDLTLMDIQKDLSFDEIPPTTVKKIIAGSGKASKLEVQNSLKYYVGEHEYKTDDESDAVACAIAYLISKKFPIRGLSITKLKQEQIENRRSAKKRSDMAREHLALAREKRLNNLKKKKENNPTD